MISAPRFRNIPRANLPEPAPKQNHPERHKATVHCSKVPNTRNILISSSHSVSLLLEGTKLRPNCRTTVQPRSALETRTPFLSVILLQHQKPRTRYLIFLLPAPSLGDQQMSRDTTKKLQPTRLKVYHQF